MPQNREELINWAKAEAIRLDRIASQATPGSLAYQVGYRAASALDFLRLHAPGTHFIDSGTRLFNTEGKILYARQALEALASLLEAWVRFVEDGIADLQPFPVQARVEAATDLLEQVQQLLDDRKVHAAAPVMLAGAALEEFLRSRISALNLPAPSKPGINTYAAALAAESDLSKQEVKDITAWAGQRNEAAHGEFDNLSRQRAQIMVDGINLFLQKRT
jgi:hypothetical protein